MIVMMMVMLVMWKSAVLVYVKNLCLVLILFFCLLLACAPWPCLLHAYHWPSPDHCQ